MQFYVTGIPVSYVNVFQNIPRVGYRAFSTTTRQLKNKVPQHQKLFQVRASEFNSQRLNTIINNELLKEWCELLRWLNIQTLSRKIRTVFTA